MLKSIVNGVEHDIVSIPMKTRNLFDEATATYGKYINSEGVETVSATGETNHSDYISVHENTSYTLSATKPTYNNITSAISWYDENKTFITRSSYAVPSNAGRFSWTADSPIDAAFAIINFTRYSNFDGENDMLNLGSTALPYEPYGYQNGWEIRDNQNKLIWGREDELQTITGTLSFKGYSLPVKVKSLLGNGKQAGGTTTVPQKSVTVADIESGTDYAMFLKSDFPNVALGDKVNIIVGGTTHSLVVKKIDAQYVYIENEVI